MAHFGCQRLSALWLPVVWAAGTGAVILPADLTSAVFEEAEPGRLETGSTLREVLDRRRSLNVQSASVREVLSDLEKQTGVCMVLDRRIDPSLRITMNTELSPTDVLLHRLAHQLPDCGVSVNRACVYIGPRQSAEHLRTLCEIRRQGVRNERRKFAPETWTRISWHRAMSWEDLSTPRDIVTQLTKSAGLVLSNPEAIPHDLWKARRLPPISFAEAVTLVLIQFDLTFSLDPTNAECEVVPLPAEILIKKRHKVPRYLRETAIRQFADQFPNLDPQWLRTAVHVRATLEQHEQIAALLSGSVPRDPGSGVAESLKTRLFTLSLPDGVSYGEVIRHLRESGISIRSEHLSDDALDQTVTVSLKRVPGPQFFPELFKDLSVVVEVTADEVILRSAD